MKVKFKKDRAEFHKAVTRSVNEYFEFGRRNNKANFFMYFKTLFFLSILIVSYTGLLFGNFNLLTAYILWMSLGLSSVFLAVNCGHDAIHGAYSNKKWINSLMSKSFDLLGVNSYLWSITHNIVHHTYTSIDGADGDVDSVPFTRLTPNQKWKPFHKYQPIYIFFLYSFGTLFWVFIKDYKKFFKREIGNYKNKRHAPIQYFNLFFYKTIYYIIFLALPLVIIDMPWLYIVGGFAISHLAEGLTIATIFALAHIVEKAQFPMPDEKGNMENNWAVHQMCTTADFGRKSRLTSFFTGGLNFQIEHHLFPAICHIYYPEISEIVKEKAFEHGIPYNDYGTIFEALISHIRQLDKLGRPIVPHLAKA
ncbi:MAG: acyl-CoA desaturase [Bacteroidota bacterium]|nr:acyl-CoA desaturase [Bacteroidota bacterium]